MFMYYYVVLSFADYVFCLYLLIMALPYWSCDDLFLWANSLVHWHLQVCRGCIMEIWEWRACVADCFIYCFSRYFIFKFGLKLTLIVCFGFKVTLIIYYISIIKCNYMFFAAQFWTSRYVITRGIMLRWFSKLYVENVFLKKRELSGYYNSSLTKSICIVHVLNIKQAFASSTLIVSQLVWVQYIYT